MLKKFLLGRRQLLTLPVDFVIDTMFEGLILLLLLIHSR